MTFGAFHCHTFFGTYHFFNFHIVGLVKMTLRLQIEMIETYNDFSYIMYIICEMTASYYSRIKNIVNIPIIICSTGLSILNTTELSDSSFEKIVIIRNCGIAFNLLIALSIAVLNAYKITEKEFSFKSQSVNFLKIHNKINVDLAKCKNTMSNVDILDIVKEYNLLCESICFHIPSHIQRYVKRNYRNYKQPFMLSRPKKERRTSIISYYLNKNNGGNSNESNDTTTILSSTSTIIDNSSNSELIDHDLEYGYLSPYKGHKFQLSPVPSNVVPAVSAVPVVSDVPAVPAVSDVPAVPTVPAVPAVPTVSDVPTVPTVPDVPTVPTISDVPTVPTVPDVPAVPAVPTVPTVPHCVAPDSKRNNKRKKKSPINALNSKFRKSFKVKKPKEVLKQ